jgi:hypothetical protein
VFVLVRSGVKSIHDNGATDSDELRDADDDEVDEAGTSHNLHIVNNTIT